MWTQKLSNILVHDWLTLSDVGMSRTRRNVPLDNRYGLVMTLDIVQLNSAH